MNGSNNRPRNSEDRRFYSGIGDRMGETNETATGAAETAPAPKQSVTEDHQDMPSPKSSKSPAFQFYPRDFFASHHVQRMSMTERGAYITLLGRDWLDGGIPTDLDALADMCNMKPSQFRRMWERGRLSRCFTEKNGIFYNDRLERERRVQSEYSKKQKERADKRWNGDATALPHPARGNAPRSLPRPRSLPHPQGTDSAAPLSGTAPAALTFATVGKQSTWPLFDAQVRLWKDAYPDLDILAECRKAQAWTLAAPRRKKTASGMPAFLVNWFNRATDRGSSRGLTLAATGTDGRGRTGAPSRDKYAGIEEQD